MWRLIETKMFDYVTTGVLKRTATIATALIFRCMMYVNCK